MPFTCMTEICKLICIISSPLESCNRVFAPEFIIVIPDSGIDIQIIQPCFNPYIIDHIIEEVFLTIILNKPNRLFLIYRRISCPCLGRFLAFFYGLSSSSFFYILQVEDRIGFLKSSYDYLYFVSFSNQIYFWL